MNKARITIYMVSVSTLAYLLSILYNVINAHHTLLMNLLFSIPFQIGASVFLCYTLKGVTEMYECDILFSIMFTIALGIIYENAFYFLPFFPPNSFFINESFALCSYLFISAYLYFKKSKRKRAKIIFVSVTLYLCLSVIGVNIQSICTDTIGPVSEYNDFRKFFNIVLEEFISEVTL